MIPPVYSRSMNQTGRTLTQRVIAILKARQFLVFYAIALAALATTARLLGTWLAAPQTLAKILERPREPLLNAVTAPGLLTVAVFVLSLLATTWLRAGYLRSLAGEFSLRPRDRGQFLRLLALQVLLVVIFGGGGELYYVAANGSTSGSLAAGLLDMVLTVASIAVLYADYIVVLGDARPLTAVKLSARIAQGALLPSVIIVIALRPLLQSNLFLPEATAAQGLAPTLPMLLVQTLVVGSILFIADVVLLVLFLDAVERQAAESVEA